MQSNSFSQFLLGIYEYSNYLPPNLLCQGYNLLLAAENKILINKENKIRNWYMLQIPAVTSFTGILPQYTQDEEVLIISMLLYEALFHI